MADLVLTNGRIYTMAAGSPRADAIAMRDRRALAVGGREEVLAAAGSGRHRVIDLEGRTVVPGLTDCHTHILGYGLGLGLVDLDGATTLAEALARVREGAAAVPAGGWVRGRGWNKNLWGGGFPTRWDLDRAVSDRPVALGSKDGHLLWVNSTALDRAGIMVSTPDPAGGEIARDEQTGEPAGILKETAADLVYRVVPDPGPDECDAALRRAIARLHAVGLTGVHDMGGDKESAWTLAGLQRLREAGGPILRVFQQMPVERLEAAIGLGLRTGLGDEWIRVGGVKLFTDGALGSQTAAMLAPYVGQPENYGIVVTLPEELRALVRRAAGAGLACAIHAIGDRANRTSLDAIEAVREAGIGPGLRHRIEHVQIVASEDIPRFRRLGVIASVQPIHATSDRDTADRYWGERCRNAYAYRTLLESDASLALGSDVPVESPDPVLGIYAAVSRKRVSEPDRPAWYPDETLTVDQAVHGYSLGAACASGEEQIKGSLEPGKLADLVVLSQDIFEVPAEAIPTTRVVSTVIGGRVVYGQGW